MPHVITALCLREGSCATVCPVECIIPGNPQEKYPWFYIDPDTCIDCGACASECPYSAIYPNEEVPERYIGHGGEYLSMPQGTSGFTKAYDGLNCDNNAVHLSSTRILNPGENIDLRPAIQANAEFFKDGPGYGG